VADYPIVSIEDPFDQDDWEHYAKMTGEVGEQVQIVGDDLLVTNPKVILGALYNVWWDKHVFILIGLIIKCLILLQRVEKAIKEKSCNALLLKVVSSKKFILDEASYYIGATNSE